MGARSGSLRNAMGQVGLVPNLSLNRTQRPLSNFIYNGLDFRSLFNFSPAVGPGFLRR
jgi:hypothetical protein